MYSYSKIFVSVFVSELKCGKKRYPNSIPYVSDPFSSLPVVKRESLVWYVFVRNQNALCPLSCTRARCHCRANVLAELTRQLARPGMSSDKFEHNELVPSVRAGAWTKQNPHHAILSCDATLARGGSLRCLVTCVPRTFKVSLRHGHGQQNQISIGWGRSSRSLCAQKSLSFLL